MAKPLNDLLASFAEAEQKVADMAPSVNMPQNDSLQNTTGIEDHDDQDPNHKIEEFREDAQDEPTNLRRNDLDEEIKLLEAAIKKLAAYVLQTNDPDAFMIYRTIKRLLTDMKLKEKAAAVDLEQGRYDHESQERYGSKKFKRVAFFKPGTMIDFKHNDEIWTGTVIGNDGVMLLVDHPPTDAAGPMKVDPYSVVDHGEEDDEAEEVLEYNKRQELLDWPDRDHLYVGSRHFNAEELSDLNGEAQTDKTKAPQPVDMRANSQHTPTDSNPKASIGMKRKADITDMQGQDIDVHDVVEWEGKQVEVVDVMDSGNIMISYDDKLVGVHPQETVKVGFYKKSEKFVKASLAKRLAYDIGDGADIKDKVDQFRNSEKNGSVKTAEETFKHGEVVTVDGEKFKVVQQDQNGDLDLMAIDDDTDVITVNPSEVIRSASKRIAMKRTANDKLMKHVDFDDISCGVEWPKDTMRQYSDGFKQHMKCDYGYVRNSLGDDGEDLDCYIGDPQTQKVHRIDQLVPETGEHDEYKYMLGFPDTKAAVGMYLQHMPLEHFGGCDELSMDQFRHIARTGDEELQQYQEPVKEGAEDISHMEGEGA